MPDQKELSIIVPCYNCETTLAQSVESVLAQNPGCAYEIIMVDDGSTDSTRDIMKSLAERNPHIALHYHDENRGGGAARNTALKHASGEWVLCFDSDDVLGEQALALMLAAAKQKRCDAVAFGESRFFKGADIAQTFPKKYPSAGQLVGFADLFTPKGDAVIINFMYRRKAFEKTGGYPVAHGFDTQGFAFRFFSKGYKAFVCPDACYYHRQANKQSYFERELLQGRFSRNMFFILEEVLYLLSNDVRKSILDFDIFGRTQVQSGLMRFLKQRFEQNLDGFFANDIKQFLTEDGAMRAYEKNAQSSNILDKICCGIYCFATGQYARALDWYFAAIEGGFDNRIVVYSILRAIAASAAGKSAFSNYSVDERVLQMFLKAVDAIDNNPQHRQKLLAALKKQAQSAQRGKRGGEGERQEA